MPHSTPNLVSFPVNPNDKRPLPEIIAENYHFKLSYLDHVDGNRYYAGLSALPRPILPVDFGLICNGD